MLKLILPVPSRRPAAARRTRRVSPLVEGLEDRQVQSSLYLTSYDPIGSTTTTTIYSPVQYVIYYGAYDESGTDGRLWSG